MEKYGQERPPEYDIKGINIPIATYWGDNDWLAEPIVSTHFCEIRNRLIFKCVS